jgi:hypothetical protein
VNRARAAWLLGVLLLSACANDEMTQIVVVVDSDFDGFERVKIQVEGFTSDAGATARLDQGPLPRKLTLVHDGGPLGPIAVEVSAFAAASETPALVEHRAGIHFQRGKSLMLKVDLLFECIGKRCEHACVAGPTCVTAEEATELNEWDPDFPHVPVVFNQDGGATIDVMEGGFTPVTPDAGPIDSGGSDPIDGAVDGGAGAGGSSTSGSGGEGGDGGEPDAGPLEELFPFDPSNFDPERLRDLDLMAVTLDCDATFDSTDLSFGDWCGDEPEAIVVTQSDDTELVVLAMTSLSIEAAATLRLVGDRPVALAVLGDAEVIGAIDASAQADMPAAGSLPTCPSGASPGPNATSSDAAGGGSGGGFGTPGGMGGRGFESLVSVSGGAAAGNASLSPLRGGCPGGEGGTGDGIGGLGGAGGGAFQLTVAGELTISGELLAAGGGGQAGSDVQDGGGGGGSGGAILLEADSYDVDDAAVIAANGGSGAGGQPTSLTTDMSASGEDGAASTSAAIGGVAYGSGGDGGGGAALSSHAQDGLDGVAFISTGGAGGGGGGGVGRIFLRGAASCTPSGVLSPQPFVECPECSPECPPAPEHGCVGADSGEAFYFVCSPAIPFTEARSKCADAGLSLVRVDDETENAWLADRGLESLWLGATDIEDEDDWRWVDGDDAFWSGDESGDAVDDAFVAWDFDEPSGTGDAAVLVATTSEWEDQDEGDDYPYVCELTP